MNHIEDGIVAAADAQSLGGKAPEYYLQPRNLLDNSDFTNPVNQRGQTSYTEHWGYTIDRWYLSSGDSSGSIKATVTLTDGGLKFTPSSEAADRSALVQRLPQNALRAGVDYTFVAKKTDGDYLFGGIEDNTASYGFWQVALFIDTEVTLEWAALYEGSYTADTLPPYVPKDKHVEMLNCGVPLAPHNLLDNSDFTNPVNQRGATSYSTQWAYTIDRWYLPGSTVPVTVGEGYVSFSAADQFTGKAIKDGYYTAVVKLLDGHIFSGSAYYTAGKRVALIANNGFIDCYLMGDAGSGSHPRLRIQTVSGEAFSFAWAALYEGSYTADTLPPYVPKGYAAELAEC